MTAATAAASSGSSSTEYRRGAPRKRRENAPATAADVAKQVPVQFAHLAVPGYAQVTIAGAHIELRSIEGKLKPGTVANWVTCVVCDAYWTWKHLDDGRPEISGGFLRVKVNHHASGRRAAVMVRCRCAAGQRHQQMRDATEHEWKLVVRLNRMRTMRGIMALSDSELLTYLIDPRGPRFAEIWHFRVGMLIDKGIPSKAAFRRAYVRTMAEISR